MSRATTTRLPPHHYLRTKNIRIHRLSAVLPLSLLHECMPSKSTAASHELRSEDLCAYGLRRAIGGPRKAWNEHMTLPHHDLQFARLEVVCMARLRRWGLYYSVSSERARSCRYCRVISKTNPIEERHLTWKERLILPKMQESMIAIGFDLMYVCHLSLKSSFLHIREVSEHLSTVSLFGPFCPLLRVIPRSC
jgi:hypothetical protein